MSYRAGAQSSKNYPSNQSKIDLMTIESGQRNEDWLVIGTALGLQLSELRIFLDSLIQTKYQGDIALVVDEELTSKIQRSEYSDDIICIPAPMSYYIRKRLYKPGIRRFLQRIFVWLPLKKTLQAASAIAKEKAMGGKKSGYFAPRLLHPCCTRNAFYLEFIKQSSYNNILLTDVTDVFFQHDPQAIFKPLGFYPSLENLHYTLASETHNAAWLNAAYGTEITDSIGQHAVSCAGVTYGDRQSIIYYLEQMWLEILKLNIRKPEIAFDQAIHNYVLRTNPPKEMTFMESLNSPIATMNGYEETDLAFSETGHLLNIDGTSPAIIHQYNRIPYLEKKLLSTLGTEKQ